MGEELKYQLRLTLSDPFANVARNHPGDPSIAPLTQLLRRHDATLKCQYDAFSDYVKEAEAKGVEGYPLYAWPKRPWTTPRRRRNTPSPSPSMSAARRFTNGATPTRSSPSSSRWSEVRSWRRCSDTIPIPLIVPSRRRPGKRRKSSKGRKPRRCDQGRLLRPRFGPYGDVSRSVGGSACLLSSSCIRITRRWCGVSRGTSWSCRRVWPNIERIARLPASRLKSVPLDGLGSFDMAYTRDHAHPPPLPFVQSPNPPSRSR
jgi:hypothetical protein